MSPELTKKLILESYNYFGIEYKPSPLQEIEFKGKKLILKRDDLLELGCSKQRSLIPMIYHYLNLGKKKFVVSSSGNAGLVSAFCALKSQKIEKMIIFFDKNISDKKLENFVLKLRKFNQEITIENLRNNIQVNHNLEILCVANPRQDAFNLAKEGFINLRGSTDENALVGFETIADEINLQTTIRDFESSIFIPASSGTTAQGILEGFEKLGKLPKINIIQTTKTFALVKNLVESEIISEKNSPAESIVDIIGHRRLKIEELVKKSKGKAFVISSKEVEIAMQNLKNLQIETSYDSALSFAGWMREMTDNSICIFTG